METVCELLNSFTPICINKIRTCSMTCAKIDVNNDRISTLT